jgi:hypothetical protein
VAGMSKRIVIMAGGTEPCVSSAGVCSTANGKGWQVSWLGTKKDWKAG